MKNLTCEEISRVFYRLGIFKTAGSVVTLIQQRHLRMERTTDADRRYSIYGYRVSADSFISYLKSRGFEDEEIQAALLS